MIEVKNISFAYKKQEEIIDNVSINFSAGKMYSIFGASGSGKSTFLSLLGGLLAPNQGTISIDGVMVYPSDGDVGHIRRTLVSYIFQNYLLLPYLNAYENVALAMDISGKDYGGEDEGIRDILQQLDIDAKTAERKVKHLSGGEQQRVAVARALAVGTKYLLADEPTGNLDKKNTIRLISQLKEIVANKGIGIIIVTHSDLVRSATDIAYELDEGKLVPYTEHTHVW